MRDNPIHERVFGADPDHREVALRRLFAALLAQDQRKGAVLGAYSAGTLVGVCAMVPPGRCKPLLRERITLFGTLASKNSPGSVLAALQWSSCWARQDISAPHWHLGPVGVERELQGQGIGTVLLTAVADLIDSHHGLAYLETDKSVNLPFYGRFGFEVTAESTVLGVPCWFMVRRRSTSDSHEVGVTGEDEGVK